MFVQITYNKILYCKGTDVNKTSASKECTIYHYYCILDNGFKFQSYVSCLMGVMIYQWCLLILALMMYIDIDFEYSRAS